MLRVTPYYGSSRRKNEPDAPCCTLIEYAGTKVLVNVGWSVNLALPDDLEPDCIVLTDSTLQSIGGLPQWWWKRYREKKDPSTSGDPPPLIPIYATFPTVKMGQMTLYDQHAALCMDGKQPPYSLEAVDECVGMITSIKYSQHMSAPPNQQLTLTAYGAGHTVGNAFFVLQRPHDDTVVVVTSPKLNISQELVLDRSPLLQTAKSPDVLLVYPGYQPPLLQTTSKNNNNNSSIPRSVSSASARLTESVLTVLRGDGHVLLPTDASGRCLELLWQLNRHWETQRLQATYTLVWLAPLAHNVYEFARSQLEWMRLPFGDTTQHPLEFSAVTRMTSATELDALLLKTNNPTCVVASGLSLDGTFVVLHERHEWIEIGSCIHPSHPYLSLHDSRPRPRCFTPLCRK